MASLVDLKLWRLKKKFALSLAELKCIEDCPGIEQRLQDLTDLSATEPLCSIQIFLDGILYLDGCFQHPGQPRIRLNHLAPNIRNAKTIEVIINGKTAYCNILQREVYNPSSDSLNVYLRLLIPESE